MRLDVVIPAHNEEHRIGRTLDDYRARIVDPDVRFIVAVDGSDDGTAELVERHAVEDPRVRLFDLPKLGKGGALGEAFRVCHGDLIGFVDADGSTSPTEFLRLVDVAKVADGAIASRRHPSSIVPVPRPLSRRVASRGFAWGVRRLFRLPYSDTQCGAKVLTREAMAGALPFLSSRDFLFDVDLLITTRRLGYRIVETPTIWIDQDGSRIRAATDARRMAASAFRLWIHHRVLPIEDPLRARAHAGRKTSGHVDS